MNPCKDGASVDWTTRALTPRSLPRPYPDHGGFPDRAATSQLLALRLRHALALAAHVGFINLDQSHELLKAAFARSIAPTVKDKPCGLLWEVQIAVQFRGQNAFQVGHKQLGRKRPLVQGQSGTLHHAAGADAEIRAAIPALVGHRLGVLDLVGVDRTAMSATAFAGRPADRLEPADCRFLVREHLSELHQTDALSQMGFFGCWRTGYLMSIQRLSGPNACWKISRHTQRRRRGPPSIIGFGYRWMRVMWKGERMIIMDNKKWGLQTHIFQVTE